jgi:cell division protease FtsH
MDAYAGATNLLSGHRQQLLDIADALLAREVLDADQVRKLARGVPLDDVAAPAAAATADEAPRDRSRDKERPSLVPQLPKPLTQE